MMLSRNAQGLYWMGRYLERSEHLCRLLQLQVMALVDRPVREILFGWRRIYDTLGRPPPLGSIDFDGSDDYTLADSFTLAGDLTFERTNPDSVWSCFARGRENARQTRHCINAGMWACLNMAYLEIRELEIEDIWKASPENFYAETARRVNTFTGVAETSMYRDDGWRFMRLGRFIERAQFLVALLLAQIAASRADGATPDYGWTSLLQVCQAFDAYEGGHGIEVRPQQALSLLATDPLLPVSLYRSLDTAAAELTAIGAGPDARAADAAVRLAGRLCALLRFDWPDSDDREALIRQTGEHCHKLHELVMAAYIDYAIADSPGAGAA